jgi:hypothetical protein
MPKYVSSMTRSLFSDVHTLMFDDKTLLFDDKTTFFDDKTPMFDDKTLLFDVNKGSNILSNCIFKAKTDPLFKANILSKQVSQRQFSSFKAKVGQLTLKSKQFLTSISTKLPFN